jgi:hypothetical protein
LNPPEANENDPGSLKNLTAELDEYTRALSVTPSSTKPVKIRQVFETVRSIVLRKGGCAVVEARSKQLEDAGVFWGTDWFYPEILLPSLSTFSLRSSEPDSVIIETLSELRMLAIALGDYSHPGISAEQAHHYLTQVMALNLSLLFGAPTEAEREQQGELARVPRNLFRHLAERIGYEHIVDQLVEEIWRILQQRPVLVGGVKEMITQIAICRADPGIDLGSSGQGADRLISGLFSPTQACREDPGVDIYQERLAGMDSGALQYEASGFARSMHDTGLVSAYHAVLLRYLLDQNSHLVSEALGLSATGRDCMLCYEDLVRSIIREAVHPQTPQAVLGLAQVLERGILYQPPVAPALWRQLHLPVSESNQERLKLVFGPFPSGRARLMEGVLCLLGQPLGVGQGDNPTCQSARALSMWAYNDPDYLLQMVVWAARDNEIIIHFEGQPISSRESKTGVASDLSLDLDPVSLLVVPHLDRIYAEMGRRCIGREGDPHRWVNPEFHGWWAGRGFRINVDVATGNLLELEDFLRHFYACYHPDYNGNQPLIHPQPAGIAVTDSSARFIGWHAISILRVAADPQGVIRMYFYNPNNDSGQNWGNGVVAQTSGTGERFGEASLPFEEFASRLYIFHFDPLEEGEVAKVPSDEMERVMGYVYESWGADRIPPVDSHTSQATADP